MIKDTDRTIKLTISLLASNRKDTIPKCLESLRPLLEQVDSELIITDTGCDEDLVEYMRLHTDKIVPFKWCNDFAMARNVGLNMANGQWFMYIDDDEWFEDVSELIDFFNGNEEQEYVAANYVVRNYNTFKGDVYNEGVVGRIFRMFDGIRFEGTIHESITRPDGKVKQFAAYVHHYGYVFDTEEKRRAHFERNVSMLRKQIDEEPTVARYYAHIYQEYRTMNRPDYILEYGFQALECVDDSRMENKVNLCSTYVGILWAYSHKKEYDRVVRYGEEFLESKPMTSLTKAGVLSYMAEAYLTLGDSEKALECAEQYLALRDMYKDDTERYYKELAPMLNDIFSDRRLSLVVCRAMEACVLLKNVRKMVWLILQLDWSRKVYLSDGQCIDGMVELIGEIDMAGDDALYKNCVRAFGKIFTHIEYGNLLARSIMDKKDNNQGAYQKLCNIMSQVAGQNGYRQLVDIIAADRAENITKLYGMYEQIIKIDRLILSMEKEFYEIALRRHIPLGQLICELDVDCWKEMLMQWSLNVRNRDIPVVKKYLDKFLPSDSMHMQLLESQIIAILEKRRK